MPALETDLWVLALHHPQVDAARFARAMEDQVRARDLDYRSRLLIHEGLDALQAHWGRDRLRRWLAASEVRPELEAIWKAEFEEIGFPSLRERIVEVTRPEQIRSFLRELGLRASRPVRMDVGGSAALILRGYLSKRTEDIDVVDEVPPEFRSDHALRAELKKLYMLELGHFQRRYLPMRWENRIHSEAPYGKLQVYLVDAHDVFLSKLFSKRTKDREDLQFLLPQLDRETLVRRLREDCQSMLAAADLRERAEHNWYVLTGENLPT